MKEWIKEHYILTFIIALASLKTVNHVVDVVADKKKDSNAKQ